jgi:hypothetical protein
LVGLRETLTSKLDLHITLQHHQLVKALAETANGFFLLAHRYPRAIVYAAEAVWSGDGKRRELGTEERYPIFRATRAPDITMLGFPLTEQQVRGAETRSGGHPGWFFVLQQQPTEPRFGLDVATTYGGSPQHWSDLSWGHLAANENPLKQLAYVPIDGLLKIKARLLTVFHGEKTPPTWPLSPGSDHSESLFMPGRG